jgi:hypothetical protein
MAARVLIRLPECQTKRPQFGAGRDLGPPEHREGGSQCSAARRSHPDCRPLFNFEHCPNFKLRVSELGQHPLVRPRNRPISVHGGALESAASLHSGRACPHDGAWQPHTGAGDHVGNRRLCGARTGNREYFWNKPHKAG